MRAWAIILLLVVGCSKRQEPVAPSSSYTRAEVERDAQIWAIRHPERRFGGVTPTGSMLPFMDERSVALYEEYRQGAPLHRGDGIYFERDGPGTRPILHFVNEVTATHVITSGSNSRYDGWQPRAAITYRLVGVLYSTR